MNIKDSIIASGDFVLQVLDLHGNEIERFQENNLVVTLGRTNICKLLGGDTAGRAITQIAVGSNGATPDLANTVLTDHFNKDITSVAYPSVNQVRFSWSLEAAEGNGISILEFGLLNEDDILCARKVRSEPIVKSSAVRLVGSWTLTVS
jgi:hypothetical protein